MLTDTCNLSMINEALSHITKHHQKVSRIKTPVKHIHKKPGGMGKKLDYVKYPYMRDIADKHYPGWSWTIINTEFAGTEAFVIHGRLKWFDNGVWREGDMTAAHRVQKKRDGSGKFVDLGNDVKAANTDCIKKAMNTYMSICDDVYKAQIQTEEEIEAEIEALKLTNEDKETLLKLAELAGKYNEIAQSITDGGIDKNNYEGAVKKLKRIGESK